jgi:hypothetical protein
MKSNGALEIIFIYIMDYYLSFNLFSFSFILFVFLIIIILNDCDAY